MLRSLAFCAALGAVILLAGCDVISPNLGVAPTQSSAVTQIVPSDAFAGTSGFTMTVNGGNFVTGSVVLWNGSARTTAFINSTQVTAAITAADLAGPGPAVISVGVEAPATGGNNNAGNNFSNFVPFDLEVAQNPVPAITLLSPAGAAAGSGAFTLTITGTSIVSGATVLWNNQACAIGAAPEPSVCTTSTTSTSTQITANIPGTYVASVPVNQPLVSILNPSPGGGTSNSLTFTITGTPQGAVIRSGSASASPRIASVSGTVAPRFVAIVAPASDPAVSAATASGVKEIFVQDTCRGAAAGCTPQTSPASVPLFGAAPDGDSSSPSISADGRFVAFVSSASNLVADDHNGVADVFLRDTCTGAPAGCTPSTTRISVGPNGLEANGSSVSAFLSSDGRFVSFGSSASNLILDGKWGLVPSSPATFRRDTCLGASGCTPATTRVLAPGSVSAP